MKKIFPPVYLLIAIIMMTVLHFTFRGIDLILFPWNLIGIIPLVCGLTIACLVSNTFNKRKTTIKPFKESTVLITDGLFKFSRHPIYLGFTIMLLGIVILFGSLTPLLMVFVFIAIIQLVFIKAEEQMMEEQFGKEWREYQQKVRQWL